MIFTRKRAGIEKIKGILGKSPYLDICDLCTDYTYMYLYNQHSFCEKCIKKGIECKPFLLLDGGLSEEQA